MRDPLNRNNGPAIIRLFDVCFRRGVFDARDAGDDYAVMDFIAKHKYNWTFGTIDEAESVDWRTYRFILYRWARESGLTKLAENYIIMIRQQNYLWCLLPYCMWFYLMGAQEWVSYPDASKIELFKMNRRTHWDPNGPVKKFTRMDYVSYMHEAAFAYKKFEKEKQPVSDHIMENYCQAIFDLTRSYVTD